MHSWPERKVHIGEVAERVPRPIKIEHTCDDRRYPRLSGPFLLTCGPTGVVDRFIDLSTGQEHHFEGLPELFTTYRGQVYALGRDAGVWHLPDTRPEGDGDFALDPVTPAAFDGERVAVGHADRVTVFTHGESTHTLHDARPAPWYPPALPEGWMVWVDWATGRGELRGLEQGARHPVLLARGRRLQHHPVADGHWLAWVDDGDVVLADTRAHIRHRWRADAGYEGPPALSFGSVCFADRREGTHQVRCSDGWQHEGRMPSLWGGLTLIHTAHGITLHAARWLELDADDDRLQPVQGDPRSVQLEVPALWGDGEVGVMVERRARWEPVAVVSPRWGEPASAVVPARLRVRLVPTEPMPAGLR